MIGLDYGIQPKFIILGDVEFQGILAKSLEALGYSQLEHFGVINKPPLLMMIFNKENDARKCFDIFHNWVKKSDDGDAVGIGFIKFMSGEFGLCVYQEPSFLIERMISEDLKDEFDPILMTIGYLKTFPNQSDGFLWFEEAAKTNPFVVSFGTLDQKMDMNKAFRKLKINFYSEDEVPENSIEGALLRARNAYGEGEYSRPYPLVNRKKVNIRRKIQMDRFYPVTQLKLERDEHYIISKAILLDKGFAEWQIVQAACNFSFWSRNHENINSFETSQKEMYPDREDCNGVGAIEIIEMLVNIIEEPSAKIPSCSIEILIKQIFLDLQYLLRGISEDPNEIDQLDGDALQEKLKELDLF